MKKLFYILSLAAVVSLTVLSCQKEKEVNPREPSPAEEANCYGVYFPTQDASGDHVFSPKDDPVIEITVARTNDKGDINVPLKAVYSEDNIFVPETISFADGQTETTFKVRFDNAKEGQKYEAHFTIEGNDYASLYNSNPVGIDFSIMRVEMKTLKNEKGDANATVTFTVQNDFLGDFGYEGGAYEVKGTVQYYEVDGVRYGTLVPNEGEGGIWKNETVINFIWYPKVAYTLGDFTYQPIEVPLGKTGYDLDGSEVGEDHPCAVLFCDYYHHYLDVKANSLGTFLEFVDKYGQSYELSYYDGHGGFYFNLVYDIEGTNYWYGFNEGSVVGIADGYLRVDYRFKAKTDYSAEGKTPVFLEAGVDVASIKYAVYEGELTATQVANKIAAISDGTDASIEFSELALDEEEGIKYATLELSPEASGLYTFVGVAYSADKKVQNSASVVFNHIAAGDVEEHAVKVSVFTEDTPARYTNYHAYDSFAYGIAGEDLTDVHVAIFKFDDFVKAADAYFDAVKEDAKGKYALSADDLAQVNGEGGYYTVATGMPAKTQLIVIVWATNGDMEAWDYDVYTTDKLPYVWNSLGKGTLTDGFLLPLFGMNDVTVACDVYEEKNTPGLYMVTGFQLELCAAFYECDPSEIVDYEGEDGNWWNAQIVVDATDPAAVYIGEQSYGIYVNSTYGYVLMDSEATGTLADGAITFPAKNMYVGFTGNGGWYYGNSKGTFKITLPAAEAPAVSTACSGQPKTNFVLAREAQEWAKPVVSFERDPQPVDVATKVVFTRNQNTNKVKVDKSTLR